MRHSCDAHLQILPVWHAGGRVHRRGRQQAAHAAADAWRATCGHEGGHGGHCVRAQGTPRVQRATWRRALVRHGQGPIRSRARRCGRHARGDARPQARQPDAGAHGGTFDEVAFIFSPERLVFSTAREFLVDFQTLCNTDETYKKIVIDMSHTTVMDSAGLGALTNCLRMATANKTKLALWSVSDAVGDLIKLSSISNLFITEPTSNTFRFSNSIQRTKVKNITMSGLLLFRTQQLLKKIPILRIFYPILKFFFPFIDIDPSVPVHPSVRNPIKRLIDIVGSLIGLSFTAVLFIPIAIAIMVESKGNVLFGQIRCGLLSKPFRIWKFRSMVKNAEQLKVKVENQVEASSNVPIADGDDTTMSGKFFKNADDPRVTKMGKFLRKTSLDEFPQFWNVLVGDMSLVGTRPPTFDEINSYELEVEYHDERYTEWNRLDVRPGITGVWQVNGRSSVRTFGEVVNYDIEYRKNWSIWYDLKLIVQTFLVLFDRKNKAV